jgi:O-acetyl-ADP-ribose deacetylase (regulator of RNase III)
VNPGISYIQGNILEAATEGVVIPVNLVGVPGAGLARHAHMRFPAFTPAYRAALAAGELTKTRPAFLEHTTPPWLIAFATKGHWRDVADLDDIAAGLATLAEGCRGYGLRSIAIPAVGCGLGRLAWADVHPQIVRVFSPLPMRTVIYLPT